MKSESFSGVRIVSEVAIEMRGAIIELAGNRAVFDSRQRWLERAAVAAGISARMAKALFYCEVVDPKSSVVEKVRAARSRKQKDDALEIAATQELAEFNARLRRLEEAFRVADPDFFEPDADALRGLARREDKPVD